jgi:hypothetical protein
MGGRCLCRQIGASLCKDWADQTVQVGSSIESKLMGGGIQEAFRHLNGWYWAALEMQAKQCYHIMEGQPSEQVNLYARRVSPGDPLTVNYSPIKINNNIPLDKAKRFATSKLSNSQAVGAFRKHTKQVKDWLWGLWQEEDLKSQGTPGNGDNWQLFAHLVQAAWTYSTIPCQLIWIIVVLVLKEGGDYCGIGLLEPIRKVIECIINHRLDAIELHDSPFGCHNKRRMGTAIIEAKLVSCSWKGVGYGMGIDLYNLIFQMVVL